MRRLRIAHVTPAFPPYLSGVSRAAWENARAAASVGHDVHVFTAARRPDEIGTAVEDGLTVHRMRPLLRIGNAPLTPALLHPGHFDLFHLHYPWYFGAELLRLRLLSPGIPMLASYHHDVVFPGLLGRVDAVHRRTLGPMILQRAGFVTTASMDYAKHSSLWRQMGRHTDRIVELGYAIDTERFSPGPADAELARSIAGDGLLLLFVAALDRPHFYKGLPAVLRALADPRVPPARLIVVGEGEDRAGYEATAAQLGLGNRVRFLGRQSDDGLISALRTSDALILPSETQSEAFGLVVLEAMACGRPAIVSDLPGLRSLPPDQPVRLLVRPPLAPQDLARCLRALELESQRRDLGVAGRSKAVGQYGRPAIAERLLTLYERLLAGPAA